MWNLLEGVTTEERIPREVTYYLLCKKLKCLPGVGGLLDQDPALVEAFVICMNQEGTHQRYKDEKAAQEQRHKEKVKEARGQG